MGLTFGWIITGIACVGIIACIIGLLVSGKIFAKQKKKLLQKIEME